MSKYDPIARACKGPKGQFNLKAFNIAWKKLHGGVDESLSSLTKQKKLRARAERRKASRDQKKGKPPNS